MRLLLDTHALVWWAAGDKRLSNRATSLLTDPANELLLSAAVVWEISIKAALGRLALGGTPDQLTQRAIGSMRMIPLPIRIEHALDVYGLPPHHQDPFDRILVSQARIEGVPLISRDPKMTAYGIPVEW